MTVLKSAVITTGTTLPDPVATKRALGDKHVLTDASGTVLGEYTVTSVSSVLTFKAGAGGTSVGLGVPSTSGRSNGDQHFDRVAGRTYILVVDAGGTAAWQSSSGTVTTQASALPGFTGRLAGDHAFDTTALKDYVLTGAAGTTVSDAFGRADAASLGTADSGGSWVAFNAQTQIAIVSSKASFKTVGGTYNIINLGSASAAEMSADIVLPASGAGDQVDLSLRATTSAGGYNLTIRNGGVVIRRGNPAAAALKATLTAVRPTSGRYTITVSADALPIVRGYKDGVLLGSWTEDSAALVGTYAGLYGETTVNDAVQVDNVSAFAVGTLAWTAPAGVQSSVGFGLPTTTGRNAGDFHYDRVAARGYELINGAWVSSAGSVNTTASGLPTFAGRVAGDHHFDTTTAVSRDYVLTGVGGATAIVDTFTRANGTIVGSSPDSGATTWASGGTGEDASIVTNRIECPASVSRLASIQLGTSAAHDVQMTFSGNLSDAQLRVRKASAARDADCYFITGNYTLTNFYLFSRKSGSNTQLAQFNGAAVAGSTYRLTVATVGGNAVLKVYKDGALLTSAAGSTSYVDSSSPITTGNFVSFFIGSGSGSPAYGDDFYGIDTGTLAWNLSQSPTELVNTVAASGAAQTIPDPTTATLSRITLSANCTFTFPTVAAGKSFTLALAQDGTGSRTATWPGTVKWQGGVTPVLTPTAAKEDVFTFISTDGTNWLGSVAGQNW